MTGERLRDRLAQLHVEIDSARLQLVAYWRDTGSCPCGARREDPTGYPHVGGCPTAVAIAVAEQEAWEETHEQ